MCVTTNFTNAEVWVIITVCVLVSVLMPTDAKYHVNFFFRARKLTFAPHSNDECESWFRLMCSYKG